MHGSFLLSIIWPPRSLPEVERMMSPAEIRQMHKEARYQAENATGPLAERARVEAALLERIINGGRA